MHGAGVVADSHVALADQLARLAAAVHKDDARAAARDAGKLAFVFSGQGPQWWGMGRELMSEPRFAAVIHACDRLIRRAAGWSLVEALGDDEASSRVHEVDVTQPALFALQAALFWLLRDWGVRPDAVVGHSLGEIAAAYAAGVLTLPAAVEMTVARARSMRSAFGHGRMLAVEAPAGEVDIARFAERVALAAVNGPRASVFAGDPATIAELEAELRGRRVPAKQLRGELAFHCEQMRPAARELAAALAGLRPGAARLPLVSTVHAAAVVGPELDAIYWAEQVVAPVRFADAIAALVGSGHTAFVEIGPHPTLASATMQCLEALAVDGQCVPTLRRGKPERSALLGTVAALWSAGYEVDVTARRRFTVEEATLPSYPWQRRRYWLEVARAEEAATPVGDGATEGEEEAATGPRLVDELGAADERTRRALLEQHIARRVAAILMLAPGEPLDFGHGFFELGMDSMMVTRLRLLLQRDLERALPGPVVFDHPSVRRLAAHLAPQLAASPGAVPPSPTATAPPPTASPTAAEPLCAAEIERQLLDELATLEAT
jgi:myxalamid-type polyketide synthase MxaE and MxaD